MAGLCEGGNESADSLKAICKIVFCAGIGCVRQQSTIQIRCSVSMLTVQVIVNKYVSNRLNPLHISSTMFRNSSHSCHYRRYRTYRLWRPRSVPNSRYQIRYEGAKNPLHSAAVVVTFWENSDYRRYVSRSLKFRYSWVHCVDPRL
ncbi:hypothetical protein ANN_09571 [Periplaneta americana]|uniref:Uncharacterized protein n=1 Tax=Periplaneta americana TaxID=6978 RepID=A0ABQ8TLN2_PERAM|nr:hypothetical protein ANN_09571 [Periplaneta americana]